MSCITLLSFWASVENAFFLVLFVLIITLSGVHLWSQFPSTPQQRWSLEGNSSEIACFCSAPGLVCEFSLCFDYLDSNLVRFVSTASSVSSVWSPDLGRRCLGWTVLGVFLSANFLDRTTNGDSVDIPGLADIVRLATTLSHGYILAMWGFSCFQIFLSPYNFPLLPPAQILILWRTMAVKCLIC